MAPEAHKIRKIKQQVVLICYLQPEYFELLGLSTVAVLKLRPTLSVYSLFYYRVGRQH